MMKAGWLFTFLIAGFALRGQSQSTTNTSAAPVIQGSPKTDTLRTKGTHIVKKGENLYRIARDYNMTIGELKEMNPGVDVLRPGMKIRVVRTNIIKAKNAESNTQQEDLIKTKHVVQKGETLYAIAKKYNTKVSVIRELNELVGNDLKVGQELWVPGVNPVVVPSVPSEMQDNASPVKTPNNLAEPVKGNPVNPNKVDGLKDASKEGVKSDLKSEPSKNEIKSEGKNDQKQEGPSKVDMPNKEGGVIEAGSQGSRLKYTEKEATYTAKLATDMSKSEMTRAFIWISELKKNQIVAIINPATNQVVYAVCQGKPSVKNNAIIQITPYLAEKLGITDSSAQVRVRYAVPK
jgi:LysM repeat protein